jgi:uncharacterized protein
VKITYDQKKNDKNVRERGLSFERADELDFTAALFLLLERAGEVRRIAVGYLDERLHVLVYQRRGAGIWVISYRKASILKTRGNMAKRKPLIDAAGEVRELGQAEFARMKPFSALPKGEQAMLRELGKQARKRQGERGKQVAPTKKMVTLRLSASVLDHFKATGAGWQTRIDETLQRVVKRPRL